MHAFTYDILTDFASDDASRLDAWVFEHVKVWYPMVTVCNQLLLQMFFENALHNATLMQELNQDRIVFFLHLLGLDTNGHGYKPNSARYNANMQLVDDGIRNLTRIFADFYGDDNRTAFVFTSDHGMSK
jgi:phosphatidylinositol glycan class N